jgi:YaiO family outer membrane protein
MLALLLTVMLSTQAPATHAEAQRLVQTGAHQEALEQYRALAAADPTDLEARKGIARLHVLMGYPGDAERVYRSVLLDAPDDLDALVGLGTALTALGQLEEARALLARAEQQAPEDLRVVAALGRVNLRSERLGAATGYYDRAVAMAPERNDVRLDFEEAHRRYDHRVEVTYFNEAFDSGISDTQSGEFTLNGRLNDQVRLFGRGQQARKFDLNDTRGGGGIDWQTDSPWLSRLQAHALVGPDNEVLPQLETGAAFGWSGLTATFTAAGRYFRFDHDLQFWAIGPELEIHAHDAVRVWMRYTRALTRYPGVDDLVGYSTAGIGVETRIHPRFWVGGAFATGIDNFDRLTIDQLGRFDANTYTGMARIDLRSLTTLSAVYDHQRPAAGGSMGRLTARIVQRF